MSQFRIKTLKAYKWTRLYLLKNKRYDEAEQQKKYWIYMKYLETTPQQEIRLDGEGMTNGLMFIGTNPSIAYRRELGLWGSPYGVYFGRMLDKAKIDKTKVWVTNLFKYPTRNNRPLRIKEIRDGLTELDIEIDAVKPKRIIAFGMQVCSAFGVQPYAITSYKGIPVVGLPHPSYINRYAKKEEREVFIEALTEESKYV